MGRQTKRKRRTRPCLCIGVSGTFQSKVVFCLAKNVFGGFGRGVSFIFLVQKITDGSVIVSLYCGRSTGKHFVDFTSMAVVMPFHNVTPPVTSLKAVRCQHTYGNMHPIYHINTCLLYTSPSPRDRQKSRMPSSA